MAEISRVDIFAKLKELIVEQLGVEEKDVKPEALLKEDLKADSLDLVELVLAIEEKFNVKISDEDAENILTVQDIIDYLAKPTDDN